MFWIMMYALLFGNSTAPELMIVPKEKVIIQAIADETRLQEILLIRTEMATQEDKLIFSVKEKYAELIRLTKDRNTDCESFEVQFDRMDMERDTIQQSLIDKLFRLKTLMNREEWEAVFTKE